MGFSEIGNVAAVYLQQIQEKRTQVIVDEFIVMPNHVHCILDINFRPYNLENHNQFAKPVADSISVIVNRYKGAVKKWCNENGFKNFEWQGRFHDHVIRNNDEYWAVKNYIINNPGKWYKDIFACHRDIL